MPPKITHYALDQRPCGFHPDPKLQQRKLWDWLRTLWRMSRVSVLFKTVGIRVCALQFRVRPSSEVNQI